MINFKITNVGDGSLAIGKADGQSVPLKPGDTVRAEIVEVLPSGGVILKVRGGLISAQTEVPLEKGTTGFFKVTDTPLSAKEFKFQFLGYAEAPQPEAGGAARNYLATPEGNLLKELMQELSASLSRGANEGKGTAASGQGSRPSADSLAKFPLEKIELLLKALPPDITALPKEIRTQLQELLTQSLKSTGQSIQGRLVDLLGQLPEALPDSALIESLRKVVTVGIDKLFAAPLKEALLNTGVAFEAKLKALVTTEQFQQPAALFEKELASALMKEMLRQTPQESGTKGADSPESRRLSASEERQDALPNREPRHEHTAIRQDLKAALLELKQVLTDKGAALPAPAEGKEPSGQKELSSSESALRNIQASVDGLLKDIETFQALSKTTDSFYTFLPVSWKALKEGELAFKRRQADPRGSVSCSCRMNLNLEQRGGLSVMVILQDKEFFVSFKAEEQALRTALDSGLDELRDAFRQNGLLLKAVHTLDKDDHSQEQLDKLGPSEGIIDVKA